MICAECKDNHYDVNNEFICELLDKVIIHNPPLNMGEEMGDVPDWCPLNKV